MNRKLVYIIIGAVVVVVSVAVLLVILLRKSSNKPKFKWTFTNPTVCSQPCGGGVSYATVICTDQNGNPAPDSQCASLGPKPSGEIPCNTQPCTWSTGPWSACSKTCGTGGTQSRNVWCPGPSGSCTGPKPADWQNCPDLPYCQWIIGPWNPTGCADLPCGTIPQNRTVTCSSPDPADCGPEPPVSQTCDSGKPCSWEVGPWTPDCLQTYVCGTGPQSRSISCPNPDPSQCGPQPSTTQICNTNKTCEWSLVNAYPYPIPSEAQLMSYNGKNVQLLLRNQQSFGIVATLIGSVVIDSNPLVFTASSPAANTIVFMTTFNSKTTGLQIDSGGRLTINNDGDSPLYLGLQYNTTVNDYVPVIVSSSGISLVTVDIPQLYSNNPITVTASSNPQVTPLAIL